MRITATLALASALLAGCASQPPAQSAPSPFQSRLSARDHFDRASDLRRAGDDVAAVAEYTAAIAQRSRYGDAYVGRGVAQQRTPEARLAEPAGFASVELRPRDAAVEDFQDGMRSATANNHPDAWVRRAMARRAQGDLDGAEADFTRALSVWRHHPQGAFERACLRYDRGQFAAAAGDFEARAGLKPAGPERDAAALRAWLCRARLGERGAADAGLRAYLAGRDAKQAGDWASQLSAYLLSPRAEFERAGALAAAEAGQMWFVVGSKKLILGDRAGARGAFEKCVAAAVAGTAEHRTAQAELAALRKDLLNGASARDSVRK